MSSRRNSDNSSTVLTFTDKSGTSKNITIDDLFLNSASYDSTTHILSLGVSGQSDPVDVDLSQLVPQAVNASQVALARNITATVMNDGSGNAIAETYATKSELQAAALTWGTF